MRLVGFLCAWALAIYIVSCGGRNTGTAPLPAAQDFPLPAPQLLLNELASRKQTDYLQSDLVSVGAGFDGNLPFQRVTTDTSQAIYAPDWDAGSSRNFSGLAFALYVFHLHDYDLAPEVALNWVQPPASAANAWIGMGNVQKDRWDWRPGTIDGSVVSVASFDPYISQPDNLLLIAVVVLGTQQSILGSLNLGGDQGDPALNSSYGVFAAYAQPEFMWFTVNAGLGGAPGYFTWADKNMAALGAHWTRSNMQLVWDFIQPTVGGPYNWDNQFLSDDVISAVYISPASVNWLGSFHEGSSGRKGSGDAAPPTLRNPVDYPTEYPAFVQDVVERYDGDGVDDVAPGVHVRYWQVGNEVPGWTNSGRSVGDYVTFFRLVRSGALAADPEAKLVLVAPCTGNSVEPFLQQVIMQLAPGQEFDVIDLHHWMAAGMYKMRALGQYRALLDSLGMQEVKIWSCEHGTWSGSPTGQPTQTEEDQARYLIKSYSWNRANGLDKLMWESLVEWYQFGGQASSIFNCMGLISDGQDCGDTSDRLNTPRISFWAYKTLASKTDSCFAKLVGAVAGVHDDTSLYAYEYQRNSDHARFYILWNDSGTQAVELPVSAPSYHVTNMVTDRFGNVLEQYDANASGNKLALTVGSDPLLVEPFPAEDPPKIYVSVVMHNEEPPANPNFVSDAAAYAQWRSALKDFADMLSTEGVTLNFESDWNFLKATALYDAGADTGGKNIVRYLQEDLGFEIDPHAHETQYNYADVAYLIEQLGVTPSQIAGGLLGAPVESCIIEHFWLPIVGQQYPSYTWTAQAAWGGGTANHIDEQGLWISGIWRPRDNGHFTVHDPLAPIPHIGGYGGSWQTLDHLVTKQERGDLEPGKMYTATVFAAQAELLQPGFLADFQQKLQAHKALSGLEWSGLSQVCNVWLTQFGGVGNELWWLDG